MMVAGTAQTVRAQQGQQSSARRDRQEQTIAMALAAATPAEVLQPPPVAAAAPPAPAPRFNVTAGTEFLASSSYVWRGFQPNASFSVQPNTWVKIDNLTISSWMNIARRHVEH